MPPCRTLLRLRLLLLLYAAFSILLFIVKYRTFVTTTITTITTTTNNNHPPLPLRYPLAPDFVDANSCPKLLFHRFHLACHPDNIHIAMTLDVSYFRGSVAAIHSVLKHSSCPSILFFHFIASEDSSTALHHTLLSSFHSLKFQIYTLPTNNLTQLISPALRAALDNPLNYARNYLAHLIPLCVPRIVYLDSDLVVLDDIHQLWSSTKSEHAVIAAPEYCQADFNRYFTSAFWSDGGAKVFEGRRRRPCYFNTGVMVMDMMRWRDGGYTERIEGWMRRQKERRIYELGSLPPFLLVFAGDIKELDHRWNHHGLGGDNVAGNCRELHPGRVSLLHWSGKGKPWDRLDAGKPCSVDLVWASYDLFIPS